MGDINLLNLDALSKPIEKLLDVISTGFGVLHEPRRIRKEADAKAYEIVTLAKARGAVEEMEQERVERAQERMLQREIKRLKNTEQIVQYTVQQLNDEESVSEEPVDEDWATRFFNNAQDVSDSEMQKLWAKVLAGEIKQPKSYSLRTLEFLKNLSKSEAEIIIKAANLAIYSGKGEFLVDPDSQKTLLECGLSLENLLLLEDIGVINLSDNLTYEINPSGKYITLRYGKKAIIITHGHNFPKKISIPIIPFTIIGKELLKLIDVEVNLYYCRQVKLVFGTNVTLKIGDLKEWPNEKKYIRDTIDI